MVMGRSGWPAGSDGDSTVVEAVDKSEDVAPELNESYNMRRIFRPRHSNGFRVMGGPRVSGKNYTPKRGGGRRGGGRRGNKLRVKGKGRGPRW